MKYAILAISTCIMFSCGTAPVTAEPNDRYLAEAIYFESGTESYVCKVMAAQTIMNRVNKKNWENDVKSVVHQVSQKGTCQFSYMCDGKPEYIDYNSKTYKDSVEVASLVLYNPTLPDLSEGADHFINHSLSNKNWHKGMEYVGTCDGHSFYKRDKS